jgi:Uma2 family endonuclease
MATVTVTAAEPTREELRAALSDPDALYEIVDGRIIEVPSMSMYAAVIADRLHDAIKATARPARLGITLIEAMFILDIDTNLRRRPDVAYVSAERWPLDRPLPTEGEVEVVPDLVIEIISPSDRSGEVSKKTRDYFRHNVRQVWIVQPETHEIFIHRPNKSIELFEEGDILKAEDILPGLRIPLAGVFSTAFD